MQSTDENMAGAHLTANANEQETLHIQGFHRGQGVEIWGERRLHAFCLKDVFFASCHHLHQHGGYKKRQGRWGVTEGHIGKGDGLKLKGIGERTGEQRGCACTLWLCFKENIHWILCLSERAIVPQNLWTGRTLKPNIGVQLYASGITQS